MAAWPASTLQLAPALFIKSFLGVRLTQVYKHFISWSHHQALFGFTFAERDHCRARPNSYTARLFGEKEAATGFKIAQESWNLCHHNVMSILYSLPLFLSLCVSRSLFLSLCVSLYPFFVICCSCVPLFLSLSYFPAHPSFQFGRGLSRAMQSTWVAPVNARTPKYRRQKSRRRPIFSLVFKRFKAC